MVDRALAATQIEELWDRCLRALLERNADDPAVASAIRGSVPLQLHENTLQVSVRGSWSRSYLTRPENYQKICLLLQDLSGQPIKPEFLLAEETPRIRSAPPPPRPESEGETCLNPRYTFDTFVRGANNNLAAAAAQAVADNPARAYNPLFIYGGVGLGKTHLMHAIGHTVLQKRRSARVVYMSAEQFTNDMIDSMSEFQMKRFRNRYRSNVDVLLVDDIQFLANKERTQIEFFHTFNELHGANKQIVLSSDRPPKQIPTLEDRLRSRFEWGMIADIQPPDLETRMAILRKKAELSGLVMPHEVTSYIAERIPSNIRELEGALTRVVAYCSLTQRPIDLPAAIQALQGILQDTGTAVLDIKTIQKAVCEYFGITLEEMKGKRKEDRVCRPRQIAMYLCKELTDSSYPEIGSQFGNKDHTTVMHAYKKIEARREEHYYKTAIENIKNRLKELTR